jgi:hypothetical protein
MNQMEDGGVEISFDPTQELQSDNHSSNLAEIIDEQELGQIGSELVDNYLEYRSFKTRLGNNIYKWFRSFRI